MTPFLPRKYTRIYATSQYLSSYGCAIIMVYNIYNISGMRNYNIFSYTQWMKLHFQCLLNSVLHDDYTRTECKVVYSLLMSALWS